MNYTMLERIHRWFRGQPLAASVVAHRLEEAKTALSRGDAVLAERCSRQLLLDTQKRNGQGSAVAASVQFFRGSLFLGAGDLKAAREALEAAAAFETTSDEDLKTQLTYAMNLGDLLAHLGELEQAEQVLTENLSSRVAFYGPDHAGVGYGAASLGQVQLQRGKFAEAVGIMRTATAAYANYGEDDARWQSAMVLLLLAETGAHKDSPVFSSLGEPVKARLAPKLAKGGAPVVAAWVPLLWEVYAYLESGPRTADQRTCLATLINVAQTTGMTEDRIRGLMRLVKLEAHRSSEAHAYALQALALALDETGEKAEARNTYEHAVDLMKSAPAQARAQCLRNYGTFLSHLGESAGAAARLGEALILVGGTGDAEEGRVTAALGVHLHHLGDWDGAVPRLARAIDILEPTHPERLMAMSHLAFAKKRAPCDCEAGMNAAMTMVIRETLEQYVDPGLLAAVFLPADGDIQVEVTRRPTDDERAQIQLAIAEARKQLDAATKQQR